MPITDEKTRVLLSFAMVNHGGNFATWLRDKLMHHFDYYNPLNVYLDCVAARLEPSLHHLTQVQGEAAKDGLTHVAPDRRPQFKSQGYMPIGAINANWNAKYQKAMSEADVMIMVLNNSYLKSYWCAKEWGQFQEERRRRPNFKGIAIRFPEEQDAFGTLAVRPSDAPSPTRALIPLSKDGITFITCKKVMGLGGLLWHRDDWGLGDHDLAKVYSLIGHA